MDFLTHRPTRGSGLDDDQIESNVHINTGGIIIMVTMESFSRNIDTLAEYVRWALNIEIKEAMKESEILYGNFKQNIKDDKLRKNYSLSHKKLDLFIDYFTGTYNTGVINY